MAEQPRPALCIALMVAAMLSIPLVVKGITKYLSAGHPPPFAWARYTVASGHPAGGGSQIRDPGLPAERRGSHLLRTIFLVKAMTLHLSIATVPLAKRSRNW